MNPPYHPGTIPGYHYGVRMQPFNSPYSAIVQVGNYEKSIFASQHPAAHRPHHPGEADVPPTYHRHCRYFPEPPLESLPPPAVAPGSGEGQQFAPNVIYVASTLPASHWDSDIWPHPTMGRFVIPRSIVDRGDAPTSVPHHGAAQLTDRPTPKESSPAPSGDLSPSPPDKPVEVPTSDSLKKPVKLPTGCTGLINLGNTCYMNSVLQCLSHTKVLVEHCLDQSSKRNKSKSKRHGNLVNALVDLFRGLWSDHKFLDPSSFRKRMLRSVTSFGDVTCQQDAQEFLLALLGCLHDDLKEKALKKKHQSIRLYAQCDKRADNAWKEYLGSENGVVVDIFMGQQRSSLTCGSCNNVSHTFEPALGLSLPIPNSENGSQVTLIDCLKQYFHDETLGGDEKAACGSCMQKSNAKKCLRMQKFPKIFVIQLNRFSNELNATSKVSVPVQYPITNLNFKEFAYVDANVIYNLYAVVDHTGTLDKGHYVAIIKNRTNGQWYLYDDDIVQPIAEHLVITKSAYILFYELHSAEKEKNNSTPIMTLRNLFFSS